MKLGRGWQANRQGELQACGLGAGEAGDGIEEVWGFTLPFGEDEPSGVFEEKLFGGEFGKVGGADEGTCFEPVGMNGEKVLGRHV